MKRLVLFGLLAALAACKTNPYTGRTQNIYFSESYMVNLGKQSYAEMTGSAAKARIATDPRLTAPLLRVGRSISQAANKPEYDWEFKLIDESKTLNAWALPGGKIAFYTGIYPVLQDDAGMAIVMGHEVMHALLQHSNERMSQKVTTTAVLAAATVGLRDNENRGAILAALGVGAALGYILPYSRLHETESDEQGLYLAAKAGYDPRAAIGVWERMAKLSGGKSPPPILSTHPATPDRIQNMRKWMPRALQIYERSDKQSNHPLPAIR